MTAAIIIVIVLVVAYVTVSASLVGVIPGTCEAAARSTGAATRNAGAVTRQVRVIGQPGGRAV